MRCSTKRSPDMNRECLGTATHLLMYPLATKNEQPGDRKDYREPVCKPCGESYAQRPGVKARMVPLHIHTPESLFIETVEGHRLVEDAQHEARCFDCGTGNRVNWFRFQTNGCPQRPESIEVLRHSRDMLDSELDVRAAEAARLWWDYAVDYLHTHIGDWRVVTDHPHYCAYFTFRDREYGVRHDLPAGRFGAEKLPNRGRGEPVIRNPELDASYKQAVFYFHTRITESGSRYFATYTPGHADVTDREYVILYTPGGQISEALRIPGLRPWIEISGAICDAFGPISDVILQTRVSE
ncbi:hypothetical protein [Streptomyces noursei]|uniref:Uncharacterized protein n=1 Tax=Streptomyces noursei TaxID=1971 RepID=A0A2N8PQT4_STRNR|nr:hypothetical protein [Streptomyces noursei]PNE43390.1 hypothetical protein AOB60_00120 [Streptomyces noursei]